VEEVPLPNWRSMLFQSGGGAFSKLEEVPFPNWRSYLFQTGKGALPTAFSLRKAQLKPGKSVVVGSKECRNR